VTRNSLESIRTVKVALSVALLASAIPGSRMEARAQTVGAAVRGSIARHGLGAELEVGGNRIRGFARGETWFVGNYSILTAGARIWPLGVAGSGIYLYGGGSLVYCPISKFDGGSTEGCDADWHATPSIGAGIDVGSAKSRFSVFAEGGTWTKNRESPDIPNWTSAAGFRYRLSQ
jgi:hypothetical protein